MLKVLFGLFIMLHGLVYLWYVVLSYGLVEFQPDMGWTGESRLLSGVLGESKTRSLAGILYIVATVAFVVSGIGIFAGAEWRHSLLLGSAILSSVIILLYWDGKMEMFIQKGLGGLLINAGIIVASTLLT